MLYYRAQGQERGGLPSGTGSWQGEAGRGEGAGARAGPAEAGQGGSGAVETNGRRNPTKPGNFGCEPARAGR
jgi:hypothetical protein